MAKDDLKIIIKALLSSTNDDIKNQLKNIQSIVNSQDSVKVPIEFSKLETEANRAVKKIQSVFDNIIDSKKLADEIANHFGIASAKAKQELGRVAEKFTQGLIPAKTFMDETLFLGSKYQKVISETADEWREVHDYIKNSSVYVSKKMNELDSNTFTRAGLPANWNSKGNVQVDEWFAEASGKFPNLFSIDITNIEQQLERVKELYATAKENIKSQSMTPEDIASLWGGKENVENYFRDVLGKHTGQEFSKGLSEGFEKTNEYWQSLLENIPISDIEERAREISRLIDLDGQDISVNKTASEFESLSGNISNVNEELKNTNVTATETTTAIDSLAQALVAIGVAKNIKAVTAALWDALDAAISYESALTGIRKTTDLTSQEMEDLKRQITALSNVIPMSVENLSGIAEIAGQIGVKKQNLVEFTRVIADLTVATRMSGEAAAMMLARFANITNMPQTDFERLSSSVVHLGNNVSASEEELLRLSLRLAGAGNQIGLTNAEILGMSGFLASLGLNIEAAGSSMSRTMSEIAIAVETGSDKLEGFAEVAGLSAEAFSDMFRNDSSEAIALFITGLADIDRLGRSTILLLDELGLANIRISDTLRRSANASQQLRDALEMSTDAWIQGTAAAEEAALRYSTVESQLQIMSNSAERLKRSIGEGLTPALSIATGAATATTQSMADFLEQNQWLTQAMTVLVTMLSTGTAALGTYAAATKILSVVKNTLAASIGSATVAQKGFTAALLVSPVGKITIALTALSGILMAATIGIGNFNKSQEESRSRTLELSNALNNQINTIDNLKAQIQDEASSRENIIDMLSMQNSKYAEELSAISDVNAVRERAIKLLEEEAKARARETVRETGTQFSAAQDYLSSTGHFSGYFNLLGLTPSQTTPEMALSGLAAEIDFLNSKRDESIELSKQEIDILRNLEREYANRKKSVNEAKIIIEAYEKAQSILNETYISTVENLKNVSDELVDTPNTGSIAARELSEVLKETADIMAIVAAAEKEMADNGEISVGTLQRLIGTGEDYLKYLDMSSGSLQLNTQALKHNIITMLEAEKTAAAEEAARIGREQTAKQIETSRVARSSEYYNSLMEEITALQVSRVEQIERRNLIETLINSILKETAVIIDLNEELNNIQAAYNTVSKAIEEYNENSTISINTYQELLKIAPQYLSLLLDEEGNLVLTEKALHEVTKARIAELAQKQAAALLDTVAHYDNEADALSHLSTRIDIVTGSLAEMNAELLKTIQINLGDEVYSIVSAQLSTIEKMRDAAIAGIGVRGIGNNRSAPPTRAATPVQRPLDTSNLFNEQLSDVSKIAKDFEEKVKSIELL